MGEAEFEEFFRLVHPQLVRFALRRFDAPTAEELASKALRAVWDRRPAVPAEGVASPRLAHLAFSLLIGLMRHEHQAAESAVRWPEWAEDLALSDRDVLELVAEGYAAGEIAVILGCSPAAVYQRISRARKRAAFLMRRGVTIDDLG